MEKKWYKSKLVWLGVIITLQGMIPLLIELVNKQVITVADMLTLFSGALVIVLRVWFTEAEIV